MARSDRWFLVTVCPHTGRESYYHKKPFSRGTAEAIAEMLRERDGIEVLLLRLGPAESD